MYSSVILGGDFMDLVEIIKKRRSIRKFKNVQVDDEVLKDIITYSLLAPSGRNSKPVDLVVVRDRSKIHEVMRTRETAFSFLESAPVCIVICANEESSTWSSDASIVAAYIQLLATNYGLGSCWGHAHDRFYNDKSVEEEIKRILSIPKKYRVLCVIGLGYPDEVKLEHSPEEVSKEKIHFENWH